MSDTRSASSFVLGQPATRVRFSSMVLVVSRDQPVCAPATPCCPELRAVPDIHKDAMAVMDMAGDIETDRYLLRAWYSGVPIGELGGCTAAELVARGEAERVMDFLRARREGWHG